MKGNHQELLATALQQGDLSFWNFFNRKLSRSGGQADLRGMDLTGALLNGGNLMGADLSGALLRGADLQSADLRAANLEGADLQGADLRNASMVGACLSGSVLKNADLRGVDMGKALLRKDYVNRRLLQGARFKGFEEVTREKEVPLESIKLKLGGFYEVRKLALLLEHMAFLYEFNCALEDQAPPFNQPVTALEIQAGADHLVLKGPGLALFREVWLGPLSRGDAKRVVDAIERKMTEKGCPEKEKKALVRKQRTSAKYLAAMLEEGRFFWE